LSFWLRQSKSKSLGREVRVDVRNCSTLWAREGLKEMFRKDWVSARFAVNVWIVIWMFGVSLGSGGLVDLVGLTGVVVRLRVMVLTERKLE
jgi:hypothetical protein